MSKNKHNIWKKAIAIGVVCLFLANSTFQGISYAKPAHYSLATGNIGPGQRPSEKDLEPFRGVSPDGAFEVIYGVYNRRVIDFLLTDINGNPIIRSNGKRVFIPKGKTVHMGVLWSSISGGSVRKTHYTDVRIELAYMLGLELDPDTGEVVDEEQRQSFEITFGKYVILHEWAHEVLTGVLGELHDSIEPGKGPAYLRLSQIDIEAFANVFAKAGLGMHSKIAGKEKFVSGMLYGFCLYPDKSPFREEVRLLFHGLFSPKATLRYDGEGPADLIEALETAGFEFTVPHMRDLTFSDPHFPDTYEPNLKTRRDLQFALARAIADGRLEGMTAPAGDTQGYPSVVATLLRESGLADYITDGEHRAVAVSELLHVYHHPADGRKAQEARASLRDLARFDSFGLQDTPDKEQLKAIKASVDRAVDEAVRLGRLIADMPDETPKKKVTVAKAVKKPIAKKKLAKKKPAKKKPAKKKPVKKEKTKPVKKKKEPAKKPDDGGGVYSGSDMQPTVNPDDVMLMLAEVTRQQDNPIDLITAERNLAGVMSTVQRAIRHRTNRQVAELALARLHQTGCVYNTPEAAAVKRLLVQFGMGPISADKCVKDTTELSGRGTAKGPTRSLAEQSEDSEEPEGDTAQTDKGALIGVHRVKRGANDQIRGKFAAHIWRFVHYGFVTPPQGLEDDEFRDKIENGELRAVFNRDTFRKKRKTEKAKNGETLLIIEIPEDHLAEVYDEAGNRILVDGHVGLREGVVWIATGKGADDVQLNRLHEVEEYNVTSNVEFVRAYVSDPEGLGLIKDGKVDMARMADWRDGKFGDFTEAKIFFDHVHKEAWGEVEVAIGTALVKAHYDFERLEIAGGNIEMLSKRIDRMEDMAERAGKLYQGAKIATKVEIPEGTAKDITMSTSEEAGQGDIAQSQGGSFRGKHRTMDPGEEGVNIQIVDTLYQCLDILVANGRVAIDKGAWFHMWGQEPYYVGPYQEVPEEYQLPIDRLSEGRRVDTADGRGLWVIDLPVDEVAVINGSVLTAHLAPRNGVIWRAVGTEGSQRSEDTEGQELDLLHDTEEYDLMSVPENVVALLNEVLEISRDEFGEGVDEIIDVEIASILQGVLTEDGKGIDVEQMVRWRMASSPVAQIFFDLIHKRSWENITRGLREKIKSIAKGDPDSLEALDDDTLEEYEQLSIMVARAGDFANRAVIHKPEKAEFFTVGDIAQASSQEDPREAKKSEYSHLYTSFGKKGEGFILDGEVIVEVDVQGPVVNFEITTPKTEDIGVYRHATAAYRDLGQENIADPSEGVNRFRISRNVWDSFIIKKGGRLISVNVDFLSKGGITRLEIVGPREMSISYKRSGTGPAGGMAQLDKGPAIGIHRGRKGRVNYNVALELRKSLEYLQSRKKKNNITDEEAERFADWFDHIRKGGEDVDPDVWIDKERLADEIVDADNGEKLYVVRLPVDNFGHTRGDNPAPIYGHLGQREGILWVASGLKAGSKDSIDVELARHHEEVEYNVTAAASDVIHFIRAAVIRNPELNVAPERRIGEIADRLLTKPDASAVNREALAEWRDEGSPEAQIFLHLVERETCRIMLEDSLYELHVAQPGSEKEKATETARRAGAAYDGIKDIYIPHIFKGFPGGIAQTATGGEGHEEGSQASPSERTRKVVQITGVGQRLIIGGVATVDILRDQGLLRFEISAPRGKGVKAYGSELAAEGDLCWTNKAGPDEAQDRYEISQRKGDYLIVRTPGGDTKISFLTRKQIGRSGSRVLVETPRNVDYSFEKIGPAGGNAATSSEGMLGKHRSPRGVHDGITARLRKLLDDKEFVTSRGLNSESVARFKRWYDEIRTENEFDVPDDYKLPIEQLGTYDEDVGLWTVELPVGTLAVVGGESITGHLGFTTGKERGLQGVRWIAVGSKKSPRKLKEDEKQAGLTIEDAIEMDEMHEEAHYGFANDGLYLETRLKYIMGDSYVQEVAELVNPNGTVNIIKFAEWHDRASPQTQLYYYVSHAHAWRKIVNQCIDNGGRAPKRNYKRMAKLAMTRYDNAIKEYRAATRELADASPTTGPRFAGGNPAVSSGMPVENERPLSAAGQPLKLKPHQEYANSCMKAVSDSVKSEEDVLLLVVDSRIGHLGSYGHLLIKSLKEDTITQIRKMGYKGKVEVFVHEDSETITSKIETFSEEHRDNKNAIVRGIVWNEKVDSYSRLKGLKERVSLVAVDDSRFESNRNEENLRYFSIFPLIETSFTGQLMRHEYMSSQPGEADSVITSIVTLDIPPAERINPAELDELLEEDAAFWGSA